ncbi:hypothetical protein SAMN05216270_10792 [Glycomyces harbinensis]|uniref:Uncharacterized protein n=2 Tax=Glycomyces harbinensis TaxID=58114 RepID=A0A1G6XC59_9ACTN|nr:hypothetical protein SAMN05216270_10792 [Glycomyces harbinensis]
MLVLALVGCAPGERNESGTDQRDDAGSATTPSEYQLPCGELFGHPIPSAPAYTGAGPHPVVVFQDSDLSSDLTNAIPRERDFPEEWIAPEGESGPDATKAQLVLCLTETRQTGTTSLGRCEYLDHTRDVFPASYTFEVHETRTGRSVGTFDVAGADVGDELPCPYAGDLWPTENDAADLLHLWDADALADAAAQYVLAER